jgi:kinetochore protein NDC80
MRLRQARTNYLNSGDQSLQISEDVPEAFDDPHHHYALAFQFYEQAYALWLDGDDTFAEPRQALEERYGLCLIDQSLNMFLTIFRLAKKNEKVQAELEQKQEQLARAKAEYEKLASSAVCLQLQYLFPLLTIV